MAEIPDWATMYVPAPCDECRMRQVCADYHRACEAYLVFHDGGGMRRWITAPRAPTRAMFNVVFETPRDHRGRRRKLPATVRGALILATGMPETAAPTPT